MELFLMKLKDLRLPGKQMKSKRPGNNLLLLIHKVNCLHHPRHLILFLILNLTEFMAGRNTVENREIVYDKQNNKKVEGPKHAAEDHHGSATGPGSDISILSGMLLSKQFFELWLVSNVNWGSGYFPKKTFINIYFSASCGGNGVLYTNFWWIGQCR